MGIKSESESEDFASDLDGSIEENEFKDLNKKLKQNRHNGLDHFGFDKNMMEEDFNEDSSVLENSPVNRFKNDKVKPFKGIVSQKYARKITYYEPKELFQEIAAGLPILLYNNYVIDVSGFIKKHPGSSELMRRNIGTNVSLVMEGYFAIAGMHHRHSNLAMKILRTMILGKLIENYQVQIPLSLETTHPFELQTLTLIDREKVGKNVFRITFKSDKYYYFSCSRDNRLGQHFNVSTLHYYFKLTNFLDQLQSQL